jgi:hypothetical protein
MGSENWYLTQRKEHRLCVLENRVLRKTIGSKRDEIVSRAIEEIEQSASP